MIWSYTKFFEIFESIDDSLKKGRVIPALMLIYSSLTSFSLLTDSEDLPRREIFENWIKKWMLSNYPLLCNESEMYVSKCKLLNQPETPLLHPGKTEIRDILYTWGNRKMDPEESSIHSLQDGKVVFIKVEDLLESFRNGMIDCIEQLETNEKLAKNFRKKAMKLFSSVKYSA